MAEELGIWPSEQATVLVQALTKAGLAPQAKRTRKGVVVTVPDDQAGKAHETLVANMDAIARAARRPSVPRPQPRTRQGATEGTRRPMTSERMNTLARPLGLLLIGMLLAAVIRPLSVPIMVFTLAGIIYLLGKQAPDDRLR